jgi:hypothetical protein
VGCKTDETAPKMHSSGPICVEPLGPSSFPQETGNPCPPESYDGYGSSQCSGNSQSGCSTGLPACPTDLKDAEGNLMCPQCIPPDAVMISATPRDPYYIDELAKKMDEGDQLQAIRVTVNGNIPLVRPVSFRHAVLQGANGVPVTVRSDIENHELQHQAINMYSTIPQRNSTTNTMAVIDRYNNRWVIITSKNTGEPVRFHRISNAYFSRGRGTAPWWKTGYPDGTASSGLG